MSASPPKADICGAEAHVCFGQIADIANLICRHSPMSALGHKQTCAMQQRMSALPPIATEKADMPQMVMSALPPKADMCGALAYVCFGP
jgi:hypothetical protein